MTSTLQASGAGSQLSLPNVKSINAIGAIDSSVQVGASSGADVELPMLTQATGPVSLSSSNGTIDLPMLSAFTGGTIADSGGTLSLPSLSDFDGSSLQVSGGATVTLSVLTSYVGGNGYTSTLLATGAGSKLLLPKLASITENTPSTP